MDSEWLELAQQQAAICRLFSTPSRILIVWALASGELSVTEIAEAVHISLPNASQHLRLLRDKQIVESRKEGNTIIYRLKPVASLYHCQVFYLGSQRE